MNVLKNKNRFICVSLFIFLISCGIVKDKKINGEQPIDHLQASQKDKPKNALNIQVTMPVAVKEKIKTFSQEFEEKNALNITFSNDKDTSVITTMPLTAELFGKLTQDTEEPSIYYPFLIERPAVLSDRPLLNEDKTTNNILTIKNLQENIVRWATDVRLGNTQSTAKSCGYSTDHVIWHFLQQNSNYFSLTKKIESNHKNTENIPLFELQLNNLSGIREISLLKSWFDSGLLELPKNTETALQKWLSHRCGIISGWSGSIAQADRLKPVFSNPLELPLIRGFVFVINKNTSIEQQQSAKLWLDWISTHGEKWMKETGFYTNTIFEEHSELFVLHPDNVVENHTIMLENTLLNLLHAAFSGIPAMVVVKNKSLLQF